MMITVFINTKINILYVSNTLVDKLICISIFIIYQNFKLIKIEIYKNNINFYTKD